jgi:hypothetical protein
MFDRSLLSLRGTRLHVHDASGMHAVDGIRLLTEDSMAYSVFNAPHEHILGVLDRQAAKGNITLNVLEDDTETSHATLVVAFTAPVKWGMQASARAPREIVRIRDVELAFNPAA